MNAHFPLYGRLALRRLDPPLADCVRSLFQFILVDAHVVIISLLRRADLEAVSFACDAPSPINEVSFFVGRIRGWFIDLLGDLFGRFARSCWYVRWCLGCIGLTRRRRIGCPLGIFLNLLRHEMVRSLLRFPGPVVSVVLRDRLLEPGPARLCVPNSRSQLVLYPDTSSTSLRVAVLDVVSGSSVDTTGNEFTALLWDRFRRSVSPWETGDGDGGPGVLHDVVVVRGLDVLSALGVVGVLGVLPADCAALVNPILRPNDVLSRSPHISEEDPGHQLAVRLVLVGLIIFQHEVDPLGKAHRYMSTSVSRDPLVGRAAVRTQLELVHDLGHVGDQPAEEDSSDCDPLAQLRLCEMLGRPELGLPSAHSVLHLAVGL